MTMTAILFVSLLLAIQSANMATHGAHLRRRLPELTENTSSSSISYVFFHYLVEPKEMEELTNKIDKKTSNTDTPSSSYQMSYIFKYFFPEETDENIAVGLKDHDDAMPYQSLVIELNNALPDLESNPDATLDFSEDLHVTDDYYNAASEYYTDNVTQSPEIDH